MRYLVRAKVSMYVELSVEDAESKEDAETRVKEDDDVNLEDTDLDSMEIIEIVSIEKDDE